MKSTTLGNYLIHIWYEKVLSLIEAVMIIIHITDKYEVGKIYSLRCKKNHKIACRKNQEYSKIIHVKI